MALTYKHTRLACYASFATQAVVLNLPPLLFVTFQQDFGISMDGIAAIISTIFGVQIIVDIVGTRFVDKIGYRKTMTLAQSCIAVGMTGLGLFPFLLPDALTGLMLATVCNACGVALSEIVANAVSEAIPGDGKAASMSLLHSIYCWGMVATILISTLFFNTAGMGNWFWLPVLWAVIPIITLILFLRIPIPKLVQEHERVPLRKLLSNKMFILFFVVMLCGGATEQSAGQWASLFAEEGLGVSKTVGDLLGPCAFAALMGVSRTYFGSRGKGLNLEKSVLISSVLCILSYMLIVFAPLPAFSLMGCALSGLAVGIMWPGSLSLSAKYIPMGGTGMFAVLALAGNLGSTIGPALVGAVSESVESGAIAAVSGQSLTDGGLKTGLFAATMFAAVVLVIMVYMVNGKKRELY